MGKCTAFYATDLTDFGQEKKLPHPGVDVMITIFCENILKITKTVHGEKVIDELTVNIVIGIVSWNVVFSDSCFTSGEFTVIWKQGDQIRLIFAY
jgi:hypothetical protein